MSGRKGDGGYGHNSHASASAWKGNGRGAWAGPQMPNAVSHTGGTGQTVAAPADKAVMSLTDALQGIEEASAISESVLQNVQVALQHPQIMREEVEAVLVSMASWLIPPVPVQDLLLVANSGAPAAVVRTIGQFAEEPPCAALACVVATRCSGSPEGAAAHVRAGAIDEVASFMDMHPFHGGVQNVCLLALTGFLKDAVITRQAVNNGTVTRVLKAMEVTSGREVQFNGLAALRLLVDNTRHPRMVLQDNPRAPRAGLQEAAMRAKVAHQSDNAVCNAANDVLALVTPRFKEVLCWHWQSGWCKLGPRCTYAHGPTDLRGST